MKILIRMMKLSGLFIGLSLLILIGLFIATSGEYTIADTVATDPSIPHIELDGITFHATTFGDPQNPVVVVVHGGPGGAYSYLLNLHQLANDYFVVFYDQRGAGLSPRVPASELSLQSSIDDLHRIVNHYGKGEPVYLIGHSWGGMLVGGYIGQYPEFAHKAVLAEPGALTNETLDQFRDRQTASQDFTYYRILVPTIFESFHLEPPDTEARMDYIFGQMTEQFVSSGASSYQCDEPVKAVQPGVPVPPSRFGATAFSTIFGETADLSPIAENAGNYTNEVLFMAGECNTFIGPDFQREQMSIFPQAQLVVIPDAGHEMIGENPTASMTAIQTYFDAK